MTQRKEGWYWVVKNGSWEVCLFQAGYWLHSGDDNDSTDGDFERIVEYIPTPDEPWQCVPKEANQDMIRAAHKRGAVFGFGAHFAAALSAAPKPGDV